MFNNSTTANTNTIYFYIVAYYPLCLVVVGTVLNLLTFITLCRAPFRNTKKQPAMHYMRAIAIFDILMLYGWNLDHYLSAIHGFTLTSYSIPSCKIIGFAGYFTEQSSAWLRVFLCLDRYLALSRLNRTWFSRPKSVLIIIACIIGVFTMFNLHLIIFGCYVEPNGAINSNAALYYIYPLWDYINLGVYNCVPFICMVTLDSGVIYHLIRLRRTTTIQNSRVQHRTISITLVITTALFLIMTIPSGVAFAFFYTTAGTIVLETADAFFFSYHITSFPLYFITFTEFRRECITMITCSKNARRVAPTNTAAQRTLTARGMIGRKSHTQNET
jgi:hypothetical protein